MDHSAIVLLSVPQGKQGESVRGKVVTKFFCNYQDGKDFMENNKPYAFSIQKVNKVNVQ